MVGVVGSGSGSGPAGGGGGFAPAGVDAGRAGSTGSSEHAMPSSSAGPAGPSRPYGSARLRDVRGLRVLLPVEVGAGRGVGDRRRRRVGRGRGLGRRRAGSDACCCHRCRPRVGATLRMIVRSRTTVARAWTSAAPSSWSCPCGRALRARLALLGLGARRGRPATSAAASRVTDALSRVDLRGAQRGVERRSAARRARSRRTRRSRRARAVITVKSVRLAMVGNPDQDEGEREQVGNGREWVRARGLRVSLRTRRVAFPSRRSAPSA